MFADAYLVSGRRESWRRRCGPRLRSAQRRSRWLAGPGRVMVKGSRSRVRTTLAW